MAQYYIGLMSGTSIDGIDAVLIDAEKGYSIVETHSLNWDSPTQQILHQLCTADSEADRLNSIAAAGNAIATREALAVSQLLAKTNLESKDIIAIGAHGQTIRHHPEQGFSVQLDNGPLLAALTHIDAIVNFRLADIAQHGEGAPLTPAFHQAILSSPDCYRIVLNLGGIANITVLSPQGEIITAFDTGPANTLLDLVCRQYLHTECDEDGEHARAGTVLPEQLDTLLLHPYLRRDFPKSTGREDFNAETIAELCKTIPAETSLHYAKAVNSVLATLTEFTALSLMQAVERVCVRYHLVQDVKEMVVCGGGALNPFLMERISTLGAALNVTVIPGDELLPQQKYLEAQAFAYFAYCFVQRRALNLCPATHAEQASILGCLCPAPEGAFARGEY